jgi:hypothetical protein
MFVIGMLPSTEAFNKQKAIQAFCKLMPASETNKRRDNNYCRLDNQ